MVSTQTDQVVRRARRGPSFVIAGSAGLGNALIVLVCLPALLRLGGPTAVLLCVLAAAQVGSVLVAVIRPVRIWLVGTTAAAVLSFWLVTEAGGVGAAVWAPVDATVGLTSRIAAALQVLAVVASLIAWRRRSDRTGRRRVAAWTAAAPVVIVTVLASVLGMLAASNGFTGTPLPAATVVAANRATVEYCRPDGVPLAMDIYLPDRTRTAPVVVYVHGGGFMLGNRTLRGPWASAHEEALFTPVRERLAAHGIAVAAIDYRLLPGPDRQAPIDDVRCAVRFLRLHGVEFGIDGTRIGAWGSSAGGTLVSLLALAPGPETVRAVADMFGPSDLTNLGDSSAFARTVAWLALPGRPGREALSPLNQVRPGAPPFLILHGREDRDMPIRHSQDLAARLRQSGVQMTFVPVEGTGHSLATPGERPSADVLAGMVADFLTRALQ